MDMQGGLSMPQRHIGALWWLIGVGEGGGANGGDCLEHCGGYAGGS